MKLTFKPEIPVILGCLIAINLPMLTGSTPIAWDTFGAYEEFAVVYRGVYFGGQLPLWLPYTAYGTADVFWLATLSITNFLFIGLGKLLQIQDMLMLFKASLLGEELISVFGMYLLAGQLFRKRIAALLTCLAFMTTFAVYRQVTLNFRMVYLLPLILFWLVLFVQTKSAVHLWLAAITWLFSIPGSAIYPLVVQFYGIAIFTLVLVVGNLDAVAAIRKRSCASLVGFGVLLLVTLVFLYSLESMNLGVEVLRSGRNANFVVPIEEYLTYWKSWNPLDLAASFVYGIISSDITNGYEYVFYVGLLPLAGVVAAIGYQRRNVWYATLAACIFLYAFSLRGFVAAAAYFLPFVDLTRYTAVLGTIPFRTFLILVGGFGLDLDLSIAQWKKVGLGLLVVAVAIDIGGALYKPRGLAEVLANPEAYSRDFKIVLLRAVSIAVFAALAALINRRHTILAFRVPTPAIMTCGLILLSVVDSGLFRYNYERKVHDYLGVRETEVSSLPALRRLVYQGERLMEPENRSVQEAISLVSQFQPINPYVAESFEQFDRCIPAAVSATGDFEVFSSSLAQLVRHRAVVFPIDKASTALLQVYGCQFPKLRVVSNVLVRPTDEEALATILETEDFSNLLVLSQQYSREKTVLNNPTPEATMEVTSFSPDQIQINVNLLEGEGWLVYSDAYHQDWQATVNRSRAPIERAYLSFKSIRLSAGMNRISLYYGAPLRRVAYNALAILCAGVAFLLLSGVFFIFFVDWTELRAALGDGLPEEDKQNKSVSVP